jgi:hypothetical protein
MPWKDKCFGQEALDLGAIGIHAQEAFAQQVSFESLLWYPTKIESVSLLLLFVAYPSKVRKMQDPRAFPWD